MQEQNEPLAVTTPEPPQYSAPPAPPQQYFQPQVYGPPGQQPQLGVQQQPIVSAPEPSPPLSQPSPQAYAEPQPAVATVSTDVTTSQPTQLEPDDDILLTWQSGEFDENAKNGTFYLAVVAVAVVLTAFVFWATGQDVFASLAVFLAVLGFAYLASHKPSQQDYALAQHGIYIGNKARAYEEFKNFSVSEDGGATSIMLVPHKRFGSPLMLRLNNAQKDDIVNTLSQFLPLQQRKLDAVDKLMHRMRL